LGRGTNFAFAETSIFVLKAHGVCVCVEGRLDTPCLTDMDFPSQCLLRDESIYLTQGVSGENTLQV